MNPGSATGSGYTSRYESRKPASSIASETGQRIVYGSPRARTAAGVQSRYEGALKSPVKNVGTPAESSGSSAERWSRIWSRRVRRSCAMASARPNPRFTIR